MINCKAFYDALIAHDINFFTGVPDSLLKAFCAYIADNTPQEKNVITANEGGAIALASGYHLASGNIGLVYMQNSGQGNAINPLTSLVDQEVYGIPMILLVGWRGEPGTKDEPQHKKQGRVLCSLFDALEIAYDILPNTIEEAVEVINKAQQYALKNSAPFALIVKKGTFEPYKSKTTEETHFEMNREDAIKQVIDTLTESDIVVSTTGKASREVFEYREALGHDHGKDFLTVGCMGHASQIALGIALTNLNRNVYCIDGDGAAIMHMGSLAVIGQQRPKNYIHILINNGSHDSVGGQPTAGFTTDFCKIALACGYKSACEVKTRKDLKEKIDLAQGVGGPFFLEIKVNKGARNDLGRPTTTPVENKQAFMETLQND